MDDEHKYDAGYVTKLISDKLGEYDMNGRVGGWDKSYIRCELEFLFQYAVDYCDGKGDEADGLPDVEEVKKLMKDIYGDSVTYQNCVNDQTGEEYKNWYTVSRDMYIF